ncbi:MAG TPA: chemotaxis protein CheX [Clostridiaceae bacterium]|jgi:chemotaxis protein CheX|nr:chemotaxis protein CheX [Clostridiaceae bacterium]
MKVEYINPFIEASQSVLKQMTGVEAKLKKVFLKTSPYDSDSVVCILGVTGKIRGQVLLSMSHESALKVASTMMGGIELTALDDVAKSAVAELSNMILGNTATILYNRGIKIEITPPSIVVGEKIQISLEKVKTICIPLSLGDGVELSIDVAAEES